MSNDVPLDETHFRTRSGASLKAYYRTGTNDWNVHQSSIVEDEYLISALPVPAQAGACLRRQAASPGSEAPLSPAPLVIDVGAHIGSEALLALSLGYRVVSVEPLPENASLYVANMELNGFPRYSDDLPHIPGWSLLESALAPAFPAKSPRAGAPVPQKLYYTPDPHHRFIGQNLNPTDAGCVTVPGLLLADLLDPWVLGLAPGQEIELLKLDIEGGEWAALSCLDDPTAPKGPQETSSSLLARVKRIVIESNPAPGFTPDVLTTAYVTEQVNRLATQEAGQPATFRDVSAQVYPSWSSPGGSVHCYLVRSDVPPPADSRS